MVKERDTAIDLVKFVAVFLVMNSHMGACYPKYQFLATGGAIGDALFFFASGFTLFLGGAILRFDEWYKKRIKRIYPSILAVAIVGAFVFGREESFGSIILAKQYWFIQCIFILYPLLFLAKKYFSKHIALLGVLTVIVMAIFPFFYKGEGLFYGSGYYRWAVYLLFMLLGAIVGKERAKIKQMNVWIAIVLTFFCIVVWYGMGYLLGNSSLQILSIIPLMGVTVFIYMIGKSKPLDRLLHSKIGGPIVISIGALCLESYLVQKMIITDAWNTLFPWNVPLIMVLVLISAYCVKVIANLIGQIFDSQPLNWHGVVRIY